MTAQRESIPLASARPRADVTPMQPITVYYRSAFGQTRLYVSDSTQAAHLRSLTGSLTLEQRHVDALKALGFTFSTVPDPRNGVQAGPAL